MNLPQKTRTNFNGNVDNKYKIVLELGVLKMHTLIDKKHVLETHIQVTEAVVRTCFCQKLLGATKSLQDFVDGLGRVLNSFAPSFL